MTADEIYMRAVADIAGLADRAAAGIDDMPPADLHATRRVFASAALRGFATELRARLLDVPTSYVFRPMSAEATPAGPYSIRPPANDPGPHAVARLQGYVGESCPDCANFTLVRNGTCLKCDTCGSTTGCS